MAHQQEGGLSVMVINALLRIFLNNAFVVHRKLLQAL